MSADADSESLTVLEFPEVASALGADILYLIRGTDVDRDRRITVDHLKAYVVSDLNEAISAEAETRATEDTTLGTRITNETSAREQAIMACATTAGDNVFSGKNSFAKTLGFSIESFGSQDDSSIPSRSLSKDSPAVYDLTGYGIIYGDWLTEGYAPVRCTVINTVNKGLYIGGFTGTIRQVWPDGHWSDIAAVSGVNHEIDASFAELVWDGSVLNVISLSKRQHSKSIGASATLGEPGDLPRVLQVTGSNDHAVSLADPTLCDGYQCTILRGDAGVLTFSWVFTGTFPVLYLAKDATSWVTHATGFAATSLAHLFDVYSSGGEWWIRES